MVRSGLSLCCLAALLWAAPVRGQGGEEAEEGEAGEEAQMSTGTNLRPRTVSLPAGTDADDPLPTDKDDDGDVATTESETETAGGGTEPSGDELAEAGEDDAERPFFGVSLGGKGTVGGNLWTAPENSPSYALMFDGTDRSVESVRVDDLLMGSDSSPRRVARLFRGRGRMYLVTPVKGDSFVVNGDLAPRPDRFLYSPHYPKDKR